MGQTMKVDALGVTIAIQLEQVDAALEEAARAAWSGALAQTETEAEVTAVVTVDAGPAGRALESLSQRVTLAAIEARRGELWMLHAAGLALADGRVIALVGPSGRGKTTASRVLGQSLGYVTDETVAVDRDGRVWPYRKPLSIIEHEAAPKAQREPSRLGLLPLPNAPLHLAAIVLLDRREDAPAEPVISRLALGDALEDLVSQSSYLTSMSAPLQAITRHAAAVGGITRVVYRDASSLAPWLTALTDEPANALDVVVDLPHTVPVLTAPRDEAVYYRSDGIDAVALAGGDDIAVLTLDENDVGTVRVLSGIGPAVYAASSGLSFEEIVDHVCAVHGAPTDADPVAAVRRAIDELCEAGVLELREGLWAIRQDVAWTDTERVVALALSHTSMSPLALEGSATTVWEALVQGPATGTVIIERVAAAAALPVSVVASDVAQFLRTLHGKSLLELR